MSKAELKPCPCFLEIELCCDERAVRCAFGGNYEECPLEEVVVAKNATTEGEWIECFEDWRKQLAGDKCSVCGFEHYSALLNPYKFCPNCGADMRGGK